MATLAALGIKPENVLAAEGDIVKVRMVEDIQILDPGYMIGGAETTTLCLHAAPGGAGEGWRQALGVAALGIC